MKPIASSAGPIGMAVKGGAVEEFYSVSK